MKRYVIEFDEKTLKLTRTNYGFNVFELLGLLELSTQDILKQLSGEMKPTEVERNYIEPNKTENEKTN